MSAVCPNGHTSEADDYCDTCGSPIDAAAQSAGTGSAAGSPDPSAAKSSLDLDPSASSAAPTPPTTLSCPNCHTENAAGALFCEACGYDFTTGAMPRSPSVSGEREPAAPGEGDAEPDDESPAGDSGSGSGDESGMVGAAGTGDPAASAFEWLAEVWVDPDWYQTQEAQDPCPSPGLPIIMPLRHKSVLLGRVSSSKNTNPEIDLSSDPGVSRRHAQLTTDGTRWFVEDLGSSNGTFVGPASGPLPAQAISVGPKTELDDDDRLYVGAWTRVVVRQATPDEVEAYA